MRIVTLNTWKCDGDYPARLTGMARTLERLQPDLVLLQEVFATGDGRADTAAFLAGALGLVATPAPARFKPRAFDGRDVPSSSGLALLSRQALREHHVLTLPADDRDGERLAQLARWQHRGRSGWVANLHLTHLADGAGLRSRQLGAVLAFWQARAARERLVLGGDFNAGPGSPEFDSLLRPPWRLVQPFGEVPKQTHRSSDGSAADLDHLLLGGWPEHAVLRAEVTEASSDHDAVVLDLAD